MAAIGGKWVTRYSSLISYVTQMSDLSGLNPLVKVELYQDTHPEPESPGL